MSQLDLTDVSGDFAKTHGGKRSEMYVFYGMTQSEYRTNHIAKDVQMHDLITPNDAPIFAISWDPNQKIRNANTYYHHPRHAWLIEEQCKEKAVKCQCHVPSGRADDKKALEEQPDAVLEFLLRRFDVES